MSNSPFKTSPVDQRVDVDDAYAADAVEQVVHRQETVILSGPSRGWEVRGRIERNSEGELVFIPDSWDGSSSSFQVDDVCTLFFYRDGQAHGADARLSKVTRRNAAPALVLDHPEKMWRRQRRQFWRARVRDSSFVDIRSVRGKTICSGPMLNVSPDGLACRIGSLQAVRLIIGTEYGLRFVIESEPQPFEVMAVLKGVLSAGDPIDSILRWQFMHTVDEAATRTRVREAIESVTRSI